MKVLPIGRLRHRVILEHEVSTPDGAGGRITSWQPMFETWACIEETGGGETFEADGHKSRLAVTITLRSRADVVPQRRFRMGSRVFHIVSVRAAPPERSRMLCTCEERDL